MQIGMVSLGKIDANDVGTSGGIWGLTEGYSMMVGGELKIQSYPILEGGWRIAVRDAGR